MVKRRFRRRTYKKRTYRKRRSYRSKRAKKTNYDGTVYAKCITTRSMLTTGTATEQYACNVISFGDQGVTDNNNTYIDDCVEFNTLKDRYKEYKITGLKVMFSPFYGFDSAAVN